MFADEYEFVTDRVTKFFNTVFIDGWFHHPTDSLKKVRVIDRNVRDYIAEVGLPHGGVEGSLGPNKGFRLQAFRTNDSLPENMHLEFLTHGGWKKRVPVLDLAKDRVDRYPTHDLAKNFVATVNATEGAKLLDIGGRARSRIDRSRDFNVDCTVFDILPGDNVDVVGDAHELSRHFPSESFDFVYSISVFEHLLMPWKVAAEINKVLKMGGAGLIYTHQTLGMHDMPWDFWRFSDTGWAALFNKKTGFEIERSVLDCEQFVLPFVVRPTKIHAEQSAGFEGCAVLFRKTGPCELSWDVSLNEIIDTAYPDTDDNQAGERDYV